MNNDTTTPTPKKPTFTRYEVFIIAVLAFIQFSIILDFMVLSPLSAILLEELNLSPAQFGMVVSAYAFSAGISGLLAAGFADKFDRKKLLLFFYTGFVAGTFLCAIADSYVFLLAARIVTGIFGGVIGSISFAIVSDLFKLEVRGRVMGFIQTAFAASQVLGLPVGWWLATHYGWHSPFFMIVGFSVLVGIAMVVYMKPITEHLKIKSERNAFQHLFKTISVKDYRKAFLAMVLLATGGFMLMPLGAAFTVKNLGIDKNDLTMLYTITGLFSIGFGPLIGKLADSWGKYKVYVMGTIIGGITVVTYTNLGITPFWLVTTINVILFVGISSRIISSSAMMTAVPAPQDRGAFMSINSSIQQIAGGFASALAGMIVVQQANGKLDHYEILGYVVIVSMLVALYLMYRMAVMIKAKTGEETI